jgi:hypothetical protein
MNAENIPVYVIVELLIRVSYVYEGLETMKLMFFILAGL